jgi:hypothetical protein
MDKIAYLDGALRAIPGNSIPIIIATCVIVLQERIPTKTIQTPANLTLIVE